MTNYIQQEIENRLARLKDASAKRNYMLPGQYQDSMPASLGFKQPDESARFGILDQVHNQGTQETANVMEQAKQDAMRRQYLKIQHERDHALKQLQYAQNHQPAYNPGNISGLGSQTITHHAAPAPGGPGSGAIGNGGGGDYGGYNGSPPSHVGVSQYLTTVHAAGHAFTVNKYVANRFVGFVNALASRGYKIATIGGYANRNQASGTGLKSLHAYGLAIDINPASNPMVSGTAPHSMPNWAGALAAKYGLVWGGTWKHSKDYMHFSVPYGGRM